VSLTQPAVLVCHGSSITQCHSPASLDQILPLPYGSVLRKPSADGLCARPHKTTTSPKRNITKFTTHYNSVRRPTKQSNQPGAGRFPLFPHEMHQRGLRSCWCGRSWREKGIGNPLLAARDQSRDRLHTTGLDKLRFGPGLGVGATARVYWISQRMAEWWRDWVGALGMGI
jgi:hypothetical protein